MDTNTVTITAEEYYQLRQKADLNTIIIEKMFEMECRLNMLAEQVYKEQRHDSNT